MRSPLLFVILFLTVTGCSNLSQDNTPPVPQLTFAHMQKIPVDVERVEYDSYVRRGATLWDVANDLPTPPDLAMQRYLNNRFDAVGPSGVLKVDLVESRVTSTEVANPNKVLSYIPLANINEYTFEIVVSVESRYQTGRPNAKNTMRFVRKRTIPTDSTLAYREALLQKTLEELIRDIDEALLNILSTQFKLIQYTGAPGYELPVQTQLPETETNTGVYWKNFTKGFEPDPAYNNQAPQNIIPNDDRVESEPLN